MFAYSENYLTTPDLITSLENICALFSEYCNNNNKKRLSQKTSNNVLLSEMKLFVIILLPTLGTEWSIMNLFPMYLKFTFINYQCTIRLQLHLTVYVSHKLIDRYRVANDNLVRINYRLD